MYFYDLTTIKSIYTTAKYVIIPINLDIPHILQLSYSEYMTAVNSQIAAEMSQYDFDGNEKVLFHIDFTTDDDLTDEDIDHFYICSISALCDYITSATPRKREKRLSVENKLNLNYSTLIKMVNYKTAIDIFNVEFRYKNIILKMVG